MGSCVGRCLPQSDGRYLSHTNSGLEFSFLVEENTDKTEDDNRNFLSRFFNKKQSRKKKPVLEFVDEILNPQVTSYTRLTESRQISCNNSYNSKDIPLQCLDARALLERTAMSTPASSVDLEWEHETMPISLVNDPSGSTWTALMGEAPNRVDSETSTRNVPNTESDWSRVSSANSLEWDNVPSSFHVSPPMSEVDTDTQLLLSEIERLTSQTLRETGRDLFS